MNTVDQTADAPVPSPLRWAGGKRWLRPVLVELLGLTRIAQYHEPFLGGASVFLGLSGWTRAFLRDSNAELIETYRVIRDQPEELADRVSRYQNTQEAYYAARAEAPSDPLSRAARFVFLNHTSFNGIYRVNLDGVYNVPYGRRQSPQIPGVEQLLAVARRLDTAELAVGDFGDCIGEVGAGDLVFLDPPYTVAHNHNGFVKYNQKLFSFDDQVRLSGLIDEIRSRDAFYVLTNAAHDSIRELFEKGDRVMETRRRNNIGGVNAERGTATELLFTNLPESR